MCFRSAVRRVLSVVAVAAVVACLGVGVARAAQLPTPEVIASADPFNANFTAVNLFDAAAADFATSGNGAGAPLSTDPNDGTWAHFDFGAPVTIDTFVNRTRVNAVDVVGSSRLIFSQDDVFTAADPAVVFDPTGSNGAGLVQRFAAQTARYVRWEVTTSTGTSQNLGARQFFFLRSPQGLVPMAHPTAYNGSAPFNPNYAWQNAANGNAGRDGVGNEYASQGQGPNTFIDFDFGSARPIAGFDFFNRESDVITAYDLIFSNAADFSTEVDRKSFTGSPIGNQVNSEVFDPVTARYVRLQATASAGSPNTGVSDITFYTPIPEPGGLALVGLAGLAALRRRRRGA